MDMKEFEVEADLRALQQACEILKDKKRLKACKKLAEEKMESLEELENFDYDDYKDDYSQEERRKELKNRR